MIRITESANIEHCFWRETDLGYKFTLQIFPKTEGVLMLIIIHHKFSLNRHLRWFLLRLPLPGRKNFATGLWKERLQDEYKKDDVLHGQISNTPKQRHQIQPKMTDLAQMFNTRVILAEDFRSQRSSLP